VNRDTARNALSHTVRVLRHESRRVVSFVTVYVTEGFIPHHETENRYITCKNFPAERNGDQSGGEVNYLEYELQTARRSIK